MPIPASRSSATLIDILDRVLDKGLVINADITVALVGTELLSIRLRAAIASFETAARYGLEFPGGTHIDPGVLDEARTGFETCPQCSKRSSKRELLDVGCPWCGWVSARSHSMRTFLP